MTPLVPTRRSSEVSGEGGSVATGEPLQNPLCDPGLTQEDLAAVNAVLCGDRLGDGPVAEKLERAFAAHCGRSKGIAVSNAALGLLIALTAQGNGPGDEVILSAHGFRELGPAVLRHGATPAFAGIHYLPRCLAADKEGAQPQDRTRKGD